MANWRYVGDEISGNIVDEDDRDSDSGPGVICTAVTPEDAEIIIAAQKLLKPVPGLQPPIRISTNVAYRLRFVRGLQLPVEAEYDDPRVADIARQQDQLFKKLWQLDIQLRMIYESNQERADQGAK